MYGSVNHAVISQNRSLLGAPKGLLSGEVCAAVCGILLLSFLVSPQYVCAQQNGAVATNSKDSSDRLRELAARIEGLPGGLCKANLTGTGLDSVLEVTCVIDDFRVGSFCDSDVSAGTLRKANDEAEALLTEVLANSPVGQVFDYSIEITGTSDGLDFKDGDSITRFTCRDFENMIDPILAAVDIGAHTRLGYYRAYLIWGVLQRIATRLRVPVGIPALDKSDLGNSPGRVLVRSERTHQIGAPYRKAEMVFRVAPKFAMRCSPGNRPVLVRGQEVCVPYCPPGMLLLDSNGTLACFTMCKPHQQLAFGESGPYCAVRECEESGQPASSVRKGRGRSAALVGADLAGSVRGLLFQRVGAGFAVAGELVAFQALAGIQTEPAEGRFGMGAWGTLRLQGWESPSLYPYVQAGFANLTEAWGTHPERPLWIPSVAVGGQWDFLVRETLSLSLDFALVGAMLSRDEAIVEGATTGSRLHRQYDLGLRLGLNFAVW